MNHFLLSLFSFYANIDDPLNLYHFLCLLICEEKGTIYIYCRYKRLNNLVLNEPGVVGLRILPQIQLQHFYLLRCHFILILPSVFYE